MITCKELAQQVKDNVRDQIKKRHIEPTLAIVSVGHDTASEAYVKGKLKDCEEVGIKATHVALPQGISLSNLEYYVSERGEDAVILQLPLPSHLDPDECSELVWPPQDVDGLTPISRFTPCTARGIYEWLKANTDLEGKHVVIINRSKLVGKPLAKLLIDSNATVTMCHSKTRDLPLITSMADIVVVAVGQPNFFEADMCKPNVIIVDVGINRVDGKLVGDVNLSTTLESMTVTPVPGGVGLLTRAYLMDNVLKAYVDL